MANDAKTQIQRLVRNLERQHGFSVTIEGKHYALRDKQGKRIMTLPTTPSDHRSVENTYAQLRGKGIDVRMRRYSKRDGSVSSFEADRLRSRLDVALPRLATLGFNLNSLSRFVIALQREQRTKGFSSLDSARRAISRLREEPDAGITKPRHDALAAALKIIERDTDHDLTARLRKVEAQAGIRPTKPVERIPLPVVLAEFRPEQPEPKLETPEPRTEAVVVFELGPETRSLIREILRVLEARA